MSPRSTSTAPWFRYHHLFADFLRLELRRSDPASIDALHGVAALAGTTSTTTGRGDPTRAGGIGLDARRPGACRQLHQPDPRRTARNGRRAAGEISCGGGGRTLSLRSCPPRCAYLRGRIRRDRGVHRGGRGASRRPFPGATRALRPAGSQHEAGWRAAASTSRGRSRQARGGGGAGGPTGKRHRSRSRDRAAAVMNVGITELWSLRINEAARHLEEALSLAQQAERPSGDQLPRPSRDRRAGRGRLGPSTGSTTPSRRSRGPKRPDGARRRSSPRAL